MPPRPDADPAELITLEVAGQRLALDPRLGGRAVSWQVAGIELLHRRGVHPVEHGMYAMAPWAGRIRGNAVDTVHGQAVMPITYEPWALHGTVLGRPAQVEEYHATDSSAMAVLGSDRHPEWPWPMAVRMHWILEQDRLSTRIVVEALGEPFPAVVGWHPWFRRSIDGVPASWSLHAAGMLTRDASALPVAFADQVSLGPHDDAFLVPSASAQISWPGVLSLDIAASDPWFVVFDELDEAMCLEPQSGPPDGLVDHPWAPARLVTPGHPLEHSVTWSIRDLRADRA
jgi:aldose 1-epimerase